MLWMAGPNAGPVAAGLLLFSKLQLKFELTIRTAGDIRN
jgi:hypothetical protein